MVQQLKQSTGLKRTIAGVLAAILEVLRGIPGTHELVLATEGVAALFGLTGLVHASTAGTILRAKLSGLASLISILILVAHFDPWAHQYLPLLYRIAAVLGAAGFGVRITQKNYERTYEQATATYRGLYNEGSMQRETSVAGVPGPSNEGLAVQRGDQDSK